jgi:type IV pilus assembly protein PilQ
VQIDRAEVSENINSNESNPSATNFPVINRRTVSTNVDVSDGETIVIGGLVQRQQVEQINRIPGLSRIPLAGRLFQTKQVEEMDVEVAIFISPRIVAPLATHTWNSSNTTSEFVP